MRPINEIPVQIGDEDRALAREMIDRIGDKWTLLIIATLGQSEQMRFTELRDSIEGVSQKMLTKTLRQLERDGLISRKVYPVVPPKVEYRLTPLGHSLLALVTGICSWVSTHLPEIEEARRAFASNE
ncbi:helix-turn-helix transcriptional regulator [Brevundimonas nasdae]|uniref:winged helix-turn-helix transcriptional regulator n=1 Tax=Brevundimonas nasdae TaxID=172043 RepID=UPI001912687D|nr:helix-turn-helix domain-containing protein [Brevundimonas nasdae]MBK6024375.1 helix-turn-helix transcriptional regulator [Brevundimonas nasdae]